MLYVLCKIGAKVDVMDYGMNVIYDLMNYATEAESDALSGNKSMGLDDMIKAGKGGVF